MAQIRLYLMGEKGLEVLKSSIKIHGPKIIDSVIADRDHAILNDYYEEIKDCCLKNNIAFSDRKSNKCTKVHYAFAIGWRFIISTEEKLIVFHDSLLPKYRGFNPLVTALVNGDNQIGVTALFASDKYDCGDIIAQKSIEINYPLQISEAIQKIKILYSDIALLIIEKIISNSPIISHKQDEKLSTYSLWRDEEDYLINWDWDSEKIERFVNAVGFPYQGAQSYIEGTKVIVNSVNTEPDVAIENRTSGKVIMAHDNSPIIVCGKGLVKINDAVFYDSKISILPLKKFRTRFKNTRDIT